MTTTPLTAISKTSKKSGYLCDFGIAFNINPMNIVNVMEMYDSAAKLLSVPGRKGRSIKRIGAIDTPRNMIILSGRGVSFVHVCMYRGGR